MLAGRDTHVTVSVSSWPDNDASSAKNVINRFLSFSYVSLNRLLECPFESRVMRFWSIYYTTLVILLWQAIRSTEDITRSKERKKVLYAMPFFSIPLLNICLAPAFLQTKETRIWPRSPCHDPSQTRICCGRSESCWKLLRTGLSLSLLPGVFHSILGIRRQNPLIQIIYTPLVLFIELSWWLTLGIPISLS